MNQASTLTNSAGSTSINYEVGNALGRLNADKPKVARRCVQVVEYARIVTYVLRAIDGYMDRSGDSLDRVIRHIKHGRIEVRCVGNHIVVVTPG